MVAEKVFENLDSEFLENIKDCDSRYLRNVLIKVYLNHPELTDYIEKLIKEALANKSNDKINDLFSKAELPCYPDHYQLKDFNEDCLIETDKDKYKSIKELSFINDDKKPNVFIHGLVGQGREKIIIGLGDLCCRQEKKTLYITYQNLMEILRTHTTIERSNTKLNDINGMSCLIIDGFAESNIYDEELLDTLKDFLNERVRIHKESFILHKYNKKKPFIPRCTIISSAFEPAEWTRYMKQDKKKTLSISQLFYDSYALSIHVDETNVKKDEQSSSTT